MIIGHKIKQQIKTETFLNLLESYSDNQIISTHHTFIRLKERERKLYKHTDIIDILRENIPLFVGRQYNENISALYRIKNKEMIRIILNTTATHIDVITFMINKYIPRTK
jgi:flagellin-specific chaperone FliS